jgi:tetraacyldisaccharide 4'-kinase
LLRPLAWLFGRLRALRVWLYDFKIFKTYRFSVPVVVVGNVVAGGVGKTPLVIKLVQHLLHMGYQPGVVSRGYRRKSKACLIVTNRSTAAEVGDEPLLIARACQVPVVVAFDRVEAAKTLLAAHPTCNVLVSDDGLQHLALGRDIEIVLFDERGVGNNWLLPAGPLREPWPRKPRCRTHLVLSDVARSLASYALDMSEQQYGLSTLADQTLHALAGIAKPDTFFQMLRDQGLTLVSTNSYSDHEDFSKSNVTNKLASDPSAIWLCTEKDAVKLWDCYPEHAHRILAVPLVVDLDVTFLSVFDVTIHSLIQQPKTL